MDIRQYIASSYRLLKVMFDSAGAVEQSLLIGAVREHIASEVFAFFPEPIRSGWIYDQNHKHTGQIDLILSIWKALRVPGLMIGSNPVSGVFANQAYAAIEVKSGISSSIGEILGKTWECHRLIGGFGSQSSQSFDDLSVSFKFPNWVPICVIGSEGFVKPQTYQEHFDKFAEEKYSVNKKAVEAPTDASLVVPDVLVDLTNDTLLVRNELHPSLIAKCFGLSASDYTVLSACTVFPKMAAGQPLMAMLYYIDVFRSDVSVTQLTEAAPLLELFKP